MGRIKAPDVHDTEIIIEQLDRIIALLEARVADRAANERGVRPDMLLRRAEYNRDNAGVLWPDDLRYNGERWYERASGKPVVFTPYGWLIEDDV